MDTFRSFSSWRTFTVVATVSIAILMSVAACSDDPVLGPSDGESEGGGSYSVIEKLAEPEAAADADSTEESPAPTNPERF